MKLGPRTRRWCQTFRRNKPSVEEQEILPTGIFVLAGAKVTLKDMNTSLGCHALEYDSEACRREKIGLTI